MAILEYLGPLDPDGNVKWNTVVSCQCDYCGKQWRVQYRTLQRYRNSLPFGSVCRICAERGRPIMLADAIRQYPRVIGSGKFGERGGVTSVTRLIYYCIDCGAEYSGKYEQIKSPDFHWRCISCLRRTLVGKTPSSIRLVYPASIPELISWDETTLGYSAQLCEKTSVTFSCDRCGNPTTTRWAYYRDGGRGGQRMCKDCGNRVGATLAGRHRQSNAMRGHWEDSQGREKFLSGREHAEYPKSLSGFHKKIKKVLVENGYTGFASEKWIARGIRVDEVDFTNKIVVEAFGDYWHANPEKYGADDIFQFPSGPITARAIWERDRERLGLIQKYGYHAIVVWESDFKRNKECVLNYLVR